MQHNKQTRFATLVTSPRHLPLPYLSPACQAFLGVESGQRGFPDPVVSNDAGTEHIPCKPSRVDHLGMCLNEKGQEKRGLTYEGELNKISRWMFIMSRVTPTARLVYRPLFPECV